MSPTPPRLEEAERRYAVGAVSVEHTDDLSMAFAQWRLNLRASNTEPLVRLNVEARRDAGLMEAKTGEILDRLDG